jgi:hypothetical protein
MKNKGEQQKTKRSDPPHSGVKVRQLRNTMNSLTDLQQAKRFVLLVFFTLFGPTINTDGNH